MFLLPSRDDEQPAAVYVAEQRSSMRNVRRTSLSTYSQSECHRVDSEPGAYCSEESKNETGVIRVEPSQNWSHWTHSPRGYSESGGLSDTESIPITAGCDP